MVAPPRHGIRSAPRRQGETKADGTPRTARAERGTRNDVVRLPPPTRTLCDRPPHWLANLIGRHAEPHPARTTPHSSDSPRFASGDQPLMPAARGEAAKLMLRVALRGRNRQYARSATIPRQGSADAVFNRRGARRRPRRVPGQEQPHEAIGSFSDSVRPDAPAPRAGREGHAGPHSRGVRKAEGRLKAATPENCRRGIYGQRRHENLACVRRRAAPAQEASPQPQASVIPLRGADVDLRRRTRPAARAWAELPLEGAAEPQQAVPQAVQAIAAGHAPGGLHRAALLPGADAQRGVDAAALVRGPRLRGNRGAGAVPEGIRGLIVAAASFTTPGLKPIMSPCAPSLWQSYRSLNLTMHHPGPSFLTGTLLVSHRPFPTRENAGADASRNVDAKLC